MGKPKARKKRDSNYIALGVLCIFIIIAVISAGVYFFIITPSPVSNQTLCPQTGPIGHVVLLVDKTDPLNYTQTVAFQELIANFGKETVQKGELCSIFALGDDFRDTTKPIFEMCNPGDGEGKSFFFSNPEKIKKQFNAKFLDPMRRVTENLFSNKSAKHSPLMEMLQMISINGFRRANVEGPKRLIIVSDMLQNTNEYSLYKDSMDFNDFRKTTYFQRVRTDLEGAEITLRYLLHTPKLQTRKNTLFWEKYFHDMNARVVSVKPLEG